MPVRYAGRKRIVDHLTVIYSDAGHLLSRSNVPCNVPHVHRSARRLVDGASRIHWPGPDRGGGRMSEPYSPLVAKLDVPAKVHLLTGASMFTLQGNEQIGLAPMAFSDGPTGVRGLKFSGGRPVSLLPNATL